jgi:hypothetical protein
MDNEPLSIPTSRYRQLLSPIPLLSRPSSTAYPLTRQSLQLRFNSHLLHSNLAALANQTFISASSVKNCFLRIYLDIVNPSTYQSFDPTACSVSILRLCWFSAEICRVRPLRPVRLPLASSSHAGRGADTPATCVARVGTVTTGSAPAFGRALAPCYGSDLLPLRLHFALQLGDRALRDRPTEGGFPSFARPGRSPKSRALCAPRPCRVRAFLARWSRQSTLSRAGLRSSNLIPLGKLRGRADRNSPLASLGSGAVSHRALPHSS